MLTRDVKVSLLQCKVSAATSVKWTAHRECQNRNTLATVFTLLTSNKTTPTSIPGGAGLNQTLRE